MKLNRLQQHIKKNRKRPQCNINNRLFCQFDCQPRSYRPINSPMIACDSSDQCQIRCLFAVFIMPLTMQLYKRWLLSPDGTAAAAVCGRSTRCQMHNAHTGESTYTSSMRNMIRTNKFLARCLRRMHLCIDALLSLRCNRNGNEKGICHVMATEQQRTFFSVLCVVFIPDWRCLTAAAVMLLSTVAHFVHNQMYSIPLYFFSISYLYIVAVVVVRLPSFLRWWVLTLTKERNNCMHRLWAVWLLLWPPQQHHTTDIILITNIFAMCKNAFIIDAINGMLWGTGDRGGCQRKDYHRNGHIRMRFLLRQWASTAAAIAE